MRDPSLLGEDSSEFQPIRPSRMRVSQNAHVGTVRRNGDIWPCTSGRLLVECRRRCRPEAAFLRVADDPPTGQETKHDAARVELSSGNAGGPPVAGRRVGQLCSSAALLGGDGAGPRTIPCQASHRLSNPATLEVPLDRRRHWRFVMRGKLPPVLTSPDA
jgi:hypothetical protein